MISFEPRGKIVFFASNNIHKFSEARRVLCEYGIAVGMLRIKSLEIQNDSLEEIARSSVVDAFRNANLPLIVEDAGLFVEALNGFPGPYAAYVYRTIGNKGLLRLMEGVDNRKAKFQSVIAYCSEGSESPICFTGEATGEITLKEMVSNNRSRFGFDPIFRPAGSGKTFAEMSLVEKNRFSHRAMALREFAGWYRKPRS